MKRILLIGTSIVALAVPAMAADLPVKAPPMMAPAPVFTWTGFYVGINGGYGFAGHDQTVTVIETANAVPNAAGNFGSLSIAAWWARSQ